MTCKESKDRADSKYVYFYVENVVIVMNLSRRRMQILELPRLWLIFARIKIVKSWQEELVIKFIHVVILVTGIEGKRLACLA